MKAKDLQLSFETFKHEFKLSKGVYKSGYMHPVLGPQSFHLTRIPQDNSETMRVINSDDDHHAIDTTFAPRDFHYKYAKRRAGRSLNVYHWLEYAIRTGRFTYFKDDTKYMKDQIRELLDRFAINYKEIGLGGPLTLFVHRLLICQPCDGTGIIKQKKSKANVDIIIDPTCVRCKGTRINPEAELIQLDERWEHFGEN